MKLVTLLIAYAFKICYFIWSEIIDVSLDNIFGYSVQYGSRYERKVAKSRDKIAHEVRIIWRNRQHWDFSHPSNFIFRHQVSQV